MPTMDITPLRSFSAVVAFSGVRRAAEALHLSPGAVTGHLRRLERELGVRLVTPQGRGLTLTSDGEELALRAREILQQHDDAIRALSPLGSDEILVAATEHAAEFLVPTVVSLVRGRLPSRSVRLRLTRSAHVRDLVHDNRADIALMLTRPARGSTRIAPVPLQWFALDEEPVSDLVLFTPPCAVRHQAIASLGSRDHRVAAECGNHTSVLGAVRAGTGMTPLPRIGPTPDGLREVRGLPEIPPVGLYIATSERIDATLRNEVAAVLRTALGIPNSGTARTVML
ncbi:LysR family transcriptional regulator [Rhodococcus sp. NBC_00294]|uniref:LysR family transcriptional regulator n=1 Tax=Rhodococcus sp. NBC_00294 TaxID=2976004 RepID=UPI002E28786E|nr:LysR family transcriptional regulator [Rhodococcus sp. NBC_00294]